MKHKDWSDFLAHCSAIQSLLAVPKGAKQLTNGQVSTLAKLRMKEELNEKEQATLAHLEKRNATWIDPPLSKTAITWLTKRYGWEKYAKKTAAVGRAFPFLEKGNQLEADAVDVLSKFDKVKYKKNDEMVTNDYLLGKCDIFSPERNIVIDVKVAWNINTFLTSSTSILKPLYWYQMQGYLELYNIPFGEVCFVLLNTPEDMVEREKLKLLNKYVFGETNREDYEKNMESLSLSLSYSNIPMKRRIIRFRVDRCPELMPKVKAKVEKARIWLNEFEVLHNNGKQIITLPEHYVKNIENNSESDSDESRENDEG